MLLKASKMFCTQKTNCEACSGAPLREILDAQNAFPTLNGGNPQDGFSLIKLPDNFSEILIDK